MSLAGILDRAVAVVSPGLALSRQRARAALRVADLKARAREQVIKAGLNAFSGNEFGWSGGFGPTVRGGYYAARRDRTTHDWNMPQLSADQLLQSDRLMLNARSRQTIRDNPYADSISQAHRRNLGYITPRAAARDAKTGKPLTEFNKALDRWWYLWARRARFCDVEGRKPFGEMQGLAAEEFCAVGESMAILSYVRRPEMVGLQVQLIEPEQLAIERDRWALTGNDIRGGIEIDERGAAVAYHIHTGRHPLEGATLEPQRVPADRVIHLMRQRRVRQTHGVTRLASSLGRLRDLGKYDEAELIAAWMEACQGLIDKTEEEDGEDDLGFTGATDGTESMEPGNESPQGKREEVVFEPGMIAKGNYEPFAPQHPGKQYEGFTKTQLRAAAAGAGFGYSTVTRDYSQGSYSSQRQEMTEEQKEVDPLQELVINAGLGQPVWDQFVFFAVLEGRLPITMEEFAADPWTYTEADWQAPARPPIDPAREAAAAKIYLDYRLDNRRNQLNVAGKDWRENFDQIEEEREYAAARGVTLPEDALGGPAVSPSEPKVHGSGEEGIGGAGEENDKGEAHRGRGRARASVDRLVESVIASALAEGGGHGS